MEIRTLITFTKVAEAQSLSKAAKLLGYAQSTVTMQMQQLEQELQVPLYERVGKQIRITQAGQELLSYAVPIIKMSQEALQVGKGGLREIDGSLRLGVLDILMNEGLEKRLDRYLADYPKVNLQIITEKSGGMLLDMLRHNEIDLLLTLDDLQSAPDLVHTADHAEEIHFFAAPEHPLEGKKGLTLHDILEYPLIRGDGRLVYEQELERQIRNLERILAQEAEVANEQHAAQEADAPDARDTKRKADAANEQHATQEADAPDARDIDRESASAAHRDIVQPRRQRMIQDQDMALRMAVRQRGRGAESSIVLAPDSAAQRYCEDGRLIQLDYQFPDSRMWQQTIYHKNKWQTAAMKAWIDMAEDEG